MGGDQFAFQFRKGARHQDGLLPRLEDRATRQAHRGVVLVGAGQFFQCGFLNAINQVSDVGPIDVSGAHDARFERRHQGTSPQVIGVVLRERPP